MVAAPGGVSSSAIISGDRAGRRTAAAPVSASPERVDSDLRISRPTSRVSGGRRSASGRARQVAAAGGP